MSYALIWRYDDPTTKEVKVIIGHPGTWASSEENAKKEGQKILADDELEPRERLALTPIALVEVDEDMGDDIQEKCEEVEVGSSLLFYDLEMFARWQNKDWWPRS